MGKLLIMWPNIGSFSKKLKHADNKNVHQRSRIIHSIESFFNKIKLILGCNKYLGWKRKSCILDFSLFVPKSIIKKFLNN